MDKQEKEYMIFRIVGTSRWNEESLRKMDDKKLEQIYIDTVFLRDK